MALTAIGLAKLGVDGAAIVYLTLGAGVVVWLFEVAFEMIPAWTVIVGVLLAGVAIGFKMWTGAGSAAK
jgi:hypothetical protein